MPLDIPRLRRWLAAAAVALICLVAGTYFYARYRVRNSLKQIPDKIGVEIQQSAKGFTISKSFEGHTLFKIEASKAVQFKEGGRGELHDVEITVYGRDSGRFDRIAGKDFEYDATTGDVIGKGEVQIDLEANPTGLGRPDQTVPSGLKNPVHLETRDLVFNQKTGDAHADGEVDFAVPQGHGSAVGLNYVARSNVLTLNSQVKVTMNGLAPISIMAARVAISRNPRTVVMEHPQVTEGLEHSDADKATVYLSQGNNLERVQAQGNVVIESDRPDGGKITAERLDLSAGVANSLYEATLSGNVRYESVGEGGMQGAAGRAVIHFAPQNGVKNEIKNVHADQGVCLIQTSTDKTKQRFELKAPGMDFSLVRGRLIRNAETFGPPQITIASTGNDKTRDSTMITAAQFEASFNSEGQLAALHGGPDSRIVSKSPGKPDRISTSQSIDAEFTQGKGVVALVQKGNFAYDDGKIKAWAGDARYTPQDQIVLLQGSPRVTDGGMTTSAQTIRLNRLMGTALAEGDVKTTDASFPSQNAKAGKPSSDIPIHITAGTMIATRDSATATYEGNVRLWQSANSVEAPMVQFHRDGRTVNVERRGAQRVNATLSQTDKNGKITLLSVLADHLTYSDDHQTVHFDGNVEAVSSGIDLTAAKMDCFLRGHTQAIKNKSLDGSTALERIVASGGVVITQPGRKVTGDKLVYTAADDRFVMTGGPPSIFDAEHGVVTGVSLTLFGRDGRVLVEGNDKSPAVTEIRVAR